MLRCCHSLVTGLLTLILLSAVPTIVGAQSNSPELLPEISPRDWIVPAIFAVFVLLVFAIGLRQFQKLFTQRDRVSEKESVQKQFTEILDRLVAPDPSVRANAALRLAEFGKLMVPLEGSTEQHYPYFTASTAQLSTALHLETNPGIRSCVRESLQMLTDFARSLPNDSFLKTVIVETADANRTARTAFIKALAEYSATLPQGGFEEKSALQRLAVIAQFGDKPEVTTCILTTFMGLHEFARDREIFSAIRATLSQEALRLADVERVTQVEVTATALRETRDALAYALRCINPSENTPAELEEDPKYAERQLNDSSAQPVASRANLSGCFLAGAQLNRAHLRYIDFRDAFLQGTSLVAADLQGALLMNAQLQEAVLSYASLQWANLDNGCLERANLSNAVLKGASLNEANLREADLIGVSFQDTSLVSANFAGACLIEASLEGACLFRIDFQEANLIRANLRKAYLNEADLRRAYLTEAQLQEAVLVSANLTGANLMQARLEGAFLKGARLEHAQIFGAVLEGTVADRRVSADFERTLLNDLNLRNPLTGQVDTQLRDWLIRYYPREARCLAIDDVPAIAASKPEITVELPAPETELIRQALKAIEAFPVPDSKKAVEPIRVEPVKVVEPRKSPEPIRLPEPVKAPEPKLFAETSRVVEPIKVVEPMRVTEPVREPVRPIEVAPQPVRAQEAAPETETDSLNDTLVLPPPKPVASGNREEKDHITVEMGDQVPLPKGWRYSTKVVVITPKAETATPVEETV